MTYVYLFNEPDNWRIVSKKTIMIIKFLQYVRQISYQYQQKICYLNKYTYNSIFKGNELGS